LAGHGIRKRNTVGTLLQQAQAIQGSGLRYDKPERVYQRIINIASISIRLSNPIP